MFNNIVFIGGIHGIGKSTLCKDICKHIEIEYLSASAILKWVEVSPNLKNKKVENIDYTQNRLLKGLGQTVQKNKYYLLDGHFCLLNSNEEVCKVPRETFLGIRPILLLVVTGSIHEVNQRLLKRDGNDYPMQTLSTMQEKEITYAKEIAETLEIPFLHGDKSLKTEFISKIEESIGAS